MKRKSYIFLLLFFFVCVESRSYFASFSSFFLSRFA